MNLVNLRRLRRPSMGVVLGLFSAVAGAESFATYIDTCKRELEFKSADIPTNLNCTTALIFEGPRPDLLLQDQTNDSVGHAKLTNDVDLVFACRWLQNGKHPGTFSIPNAVFGLSEFQPPFVLAASIELLIHNRASGKTCFFKAKERELDTPGGKRLKVSPVAIVSPTASNAADYWSSPAEVSSKLPCVDCHSAGPYIATPRIAPFLAFFGLLNDGHDTYGNRYQAVGSEFSHFNGMIRENLATSTCATGCHSIALHSAAQNVTFVQGRPLLPSIAAVIDIDGVQTSNISVTTSEVMPPNLDPYSEYRWINRDSAGGNGDYERLEHVRDEYPKFYCANPVDLETHVVGVDHHVSTSNLAMLPNKLEFFNLREGLLCRNSQQSGGKQCSDYQTRYLCGSTWTGWFQKDVAGTGSNGDFEQRSKVSLPCTNPKAVQARTQVLMTSTGQFPGPVLRTVVFNGPNDRLRNFDTRTGLVCDHSDQPDGKTCSNYVVRYICPQ